MAVYRLGEHQPKIHASAFIAPSATIIGQAEIGENASVWFGAIIRSDTEKVIIGIGTNVQDGAVLHADPGDPCILGENVTVGHRAVVHGATVDDGALIGIGAVVLNKAKVGKGAVVGAGAVVPPGMEIPDGMLAIGIPAKIRGPIVGRENAARYVELSRHYLEQLTPITPIGRYQLTFRGEEALSPFTDIHLQLKRRSPKAIEALKAVGEGRSGDTDPDALRDLEREGFVRTL